MNPTPSYLVEIRGCVNQGELNANSPTQVRVIQAGQANTRLLVQTDQSGLIGLLRHLNGRGFAILSVNYHSEPK